MQQLQFKFSGEFVTNHARNLVEEDDFDGAINFLNSLEGMDLTTVISILNGHKKLIGMNEYFLEDDENSQEYKDHLRWKFAGILRYKRKYYLPYAFISSYGQKDIPVGSNVPLSNQIYNYSNLRILHYAKDQQNDISFVLKYDNFQYAILFSVSNVPFWYENIFQDPQQSLNDYIQYHVLEERGYTKWYSNEPKKEEDKEVRSPDESESFSSDLTAQLMTQMNLPSDVVEGILGASKPASVSCPMPIDNLEGVKYGWILPNGDFYQCLYYQHSRLASEILKFQGIDNSSPEVYADKHGWIKIGKTADGTIFIGATKHLTDEQQNTLGLWGKMNNINPLEYIP